MEMTIFSIDNAHDLHTHARFLRHLSTQKALDNLVGNVVLCIGKYKNTLEPSFLMLSIDYERHVKDTDWVKGQGSILLVSSDNRQPCVLQYRDGTVDVLDQMARGDGTEEAFTYRLDTGEYYVC